MRTTWPRTNLVMVLSVMAVGAAVGQWALMGPVRPLPEMSGPVLPTEVVDPLVAVVLAGLGGLVVVRAPHCGHGRANACSGMATDVVGRPDRVRGLPP